MSQETKIYDLRADYPENVTYGPFWNGPLPEIEPPKKKQEFLGFYLNSRFGVAACPLTANSRVIRLLSELGYNVITYKSVRSREWRGNPFPHWAYVDAPHVFSSSIIDALTVMDKAKAGQEPTMANSFGIHSVRPEYWQQDVNQTVELLSEGQLLILSLMCTPAEGQLLAHDARELAKLAVETSAQVFELNLACPNTDGGKGLIYEDIELSVKLLTAMRKILGNRKLLVKVGKFSSDENMRKFVLATKDLIDGISSTNTYSAKVVKENGSEFFPGRPTAGISGGAIRDLSQVQAQKLVQLKQELDLPELAIIGIGGVTKPDHIDQYLGLGVDAVQSAVGVFENPYLVSEWKNT